MAELASGDLTQTVQAVAAELGGTPVAARQVVEAILRRHDEYGPREIAWPADARFAPVYRWLDEARALFALGAHERLHGRIAILGIALADPPSGRAIARAGLWHALSTELTPALWEGLTREGRERLWAMPILVSAAGFALGSAQLGASVAAIAYNAGGDLVAASRGRGWVVLTRSTRQEVATGHAPEAIETLGFAPDGRLIVATGGDAGLVQVRQGDDAWIDAPGLLAVAAPGGQPLAATADLAVRPLESGARRVLGEGPPAVVAAFAEHAPRLARADATGTIEVWDIDTNALVETSEGPPSPTAIAIRGDGGAVFAVNDAGGTWFQDFTTGSALRTTLDPAPRRTVAISPGGQRMAVSGRGALWDARTFDQLAYLAVNFVVQDVAFSPDGELLATADDRGVVRVYAADTGAQIAEIEQPAGITSLVWSPDGDELAVGTESGSFAQLAATLEPPRRTRLATYSPDDVHAATDLAERQAIDDDVDAFAALVAARAVTPPLSIGLFGDWGSGKTFFMRRLNARVARLSADARDSGELQRDVAWHKRIVQIEFNAWHYAEGNLWASLVEHILDNLRLSADEPVDRVDARKSLVLEEITTQRGVTAAATARLAETKAALDQTAGERDDLAEQLAAVEAEDPLESQTPAPEVKEAVDRATGALALPGLRTADEPTIANLAGAVDDARTVLRAGHQAAEPLLYAPDRGRRFAVLIAILVGAPALALLAGVLAPDVVQSLTAAATGLAAALGGVAAWIRRQLEWTRARLGELDAAAQALEAEAREQQEAQERERLRLQAEFDAANRTVAEEEARLRELEATLEAAAPARMLAQLVADRVESDDYRRHLGVLALVRRDFEAMSEFLAQQRMQIEGYETLAEEENDKDVRVGRIVLYIDDLDRCEPDQVVAVLQAVHLLLAFPLFVVVVGVDMRWVERSLMLRHQHLLASGDAAPRDYLEKIFQIPFWLEPLDAEASRRMLRGLVGEVGLAPVVPQDGRRAPQAAAQPDEPGTEPAAGGNGSASLPAADAAAPPTPLPPTRRLLPESLEVEPRELACMDELAPLLGRSPRALKRFVNTYRLIKVRSPDPAALLRDREPLAPYRMLLFLLALCTGTPHAAARFLDQAIGTTSGRVGDVLEGKGEEAARIATWLADGASVPWRDLDVADLRPYAAEVVRFTFHWHAH